MADYDYVDKTTGADYYGEGVLSTGTMKHFVWKRTVNFATAGDALVSSTGKFTSSDVLYIFNVVEGMMINYVAVEVTTAEGATCTIDVGDDAVDPNGFLKAVDLEVAGWYTPDGTYGGKYLGMDTPSHGQGKLYESADEIIVDFGHDTENAIADFWIAGVYFSPVYVA